MAVNTPQNARCSIDSRVGHNRMRMPKVMSIVPTIGISVQPWLSLKPNRLKYGTQLALPMMPNAP